MAVEKSSAAKLGGNPPLTISYPARASAGRFYVRRLRAERRLRQKNIAARVGVAPAQVPAWARGLAAPSRVELAQLRLLLLSGPFVIA
jgi:DNA-binding transcriptional regulator YiaG